MRATHGVAPASHAARKVRLESRTAAGPEQSVFLRRGISRFFTMEAAIAVAAHEAITAQTGWSASVTNLVDKSLVAETSALERNRLPPLSEMARAYALRSSRKSASTTG